MLASPEKLHRWNQVCQVAPLDEKMDFISYWPPFSPELGSFPSLSGSIFTMEHSRKAKICDIVAEKEELVSEVSLSGPAAWLVPCSTLLTCFTPMLTPMLTDKFSPSVCCKNNNLDVLTRSERGFHHVRDNYQIFCIFMLCVCVCVLCACVLSVFRAIIEPLPCRGKGRVIALLQTIQICSVHIPGIPAQGMCKHRTEVSVNRGPTTNTFNTQKLWQNIKLLMGRKWWSDFLCY